jgi:hypothetical protein
MDAKLIAEHLKLVKRVGVILITFTSILCFAATMQIVLSSVTQKNTRQCTKRSCFVFLFFLEQETQAECGGKKLPASRDERRLNGEFVNFVFFNTDFVTNFFFFSLVITSSYNIEIM